MHQRMYMRCRLLAAVVTAVLMGLCLGSLQAAIASQHTSTGAVNSSASVKGPSFRVIHDFGGVLDGVNPYAGLLFAHGVLYGTTLKPGCGTVYALEPTANKAFRERILYRFSGGNDGCQPYSNLILVGSRLYGTTEYGGPANQGTVYSVPITGGSDSILYAFTGGADGDQPGVGALLNVGNNLYGTTELGGADSGGVVFSVPVRGGAETVLHSFTQAEGRYPLWGLIDVAGKLYGTTYDTTVFSLPIAGGPLTVLCRFSGPENGVEPFAPVINVGSYLYGTTFTGGYFSLAGVVFRLPLGNYTGLDQLVYTFKGPPDAKGPYGIVQAGDQVVGVAGGGAFNAGALFRVPLAGGSDMILHSFSGGADGAYPDGVPIYAHGAIYGTTQFGGAHKAGVAFEYIYP